MTYRAIISQIILLLIDLTVSVWSELMISRGLFFSTWTSFNVFLASSPECPDLAVHNFFKNLVILKVVNDVAFSPLLIFAIFPSFASRSHGILLCTARSRLKTAFGKDFIILILLFFSLTSGYIQRQIKRWYFKTIRAKDTHFKMAKISPFHGTTRKAVSIDNRLWNSVIFLSWMIFWQHEQGSLFLWRKIRFF